MEFIDLIYDLILEEFKDKNTLQSFLKKWFGDNPTQEDEILCDFLLEKYFAKKSEFTPNKVEIKVFLQYYPDFKFENIKKLGAFTLEQMKFLIGEFYDLPTNLDLNRVDEIVFNPMFKNENVSYQEKVNLSKNIWFTETSNCIINEDGFRVYYIPNKQASQNFGIYMKSLPGSNQWCVTKPNTTYYENYRKFNDRTFYFTIDESKNPDIQTNREINKYYLTAIQPSTQSSKGYFVTHLINNGDEQFSESELIQMFPKLQGHMDKLIKVPYNKTSEDTDGRIDPIDEITEYPGPHEFARQPKSYKTSYIERGGIISKAFSWEHMSSPLKNSYINVTTSENFLTRFKTLELLDAIKKNKDDFKSFIARAKKLSIDTNQYVMDVVKTNYTTHRVNKLNPSIMIIIDNNSKKFGIFDTRTLDFYEKDGVKYVCDYNGFKPTIANDNKGNQYLVERFAINGIMDEKAFYALRNKANLRESLIMSNTRFNQLVNDGKIMDDKTPIKMTDIEPEQDFDIKEIYE